MKNFDIDTDSKTVTIAVNPKIYPLEVVYSAAYTFLDRSYVIIDGDPDKEILVQLKAKNNDENLEILAQNFNNELVGYAVYVVQAARTSTIRQTIVERALKTVDKVEEEKEDSDYLEDTLGIAKPWTPDSAKGLELPEELKEDELKNSVEKKENEGETN